MDLRNTIIKTVMAIAIIEYRFNDLILTLSFTKRMIDAIGSIISKDTMGRERSSKIAPVIAKR